MDYDIRFRIWLSIFCMALGIYQLIRAIRHRKLYERDRLLFLERMHRDPVTRKYNDAFLLKQGKNGVWYGLIQLAVIIAILIFLFTSS